VITSNVGTRDHYRGEEGMNLCPTSSAGQKGTDARSTRAVTGYIQRQSRFIKPADDQKDKRMIRPPLQQGTAASSRH